MVSKGLGRKRGGRYLMDCMVRTVGLEMKKRVILGLLAESIKGEVESMECWGGERGASVDECGAC